MTNTDQLTDPELLHLVEDIKQMIKSAQYRALQTVNTEQIALYWGIRSFGTNSLLVFFNFPSLDVNKPIGVATYTLTESLPKELSQFFPTSQELVERMEALTKHLAVQKAKKS